MSFGGLAVETFATYTSDKWSSMVHNLARMKAKETLLQLSERAATGIGEELAGLVRASSDEIPNVSNHKRVDSQWVYWFRNQEERDTLASFLKATPLDQATIFNIAPQDKHATLAVILREPEIWIGLRIAPGALVDRRNLGSKLSKSWEREALRDRLRELPEGAQVGSEGATVPTAEVTLDTLAEMTERLGDKEPTWLLGHAVASADAIELGPDLADHVGRWLGVLAPFYRWAAWTRSNDHIEATKQIQEEKAAKRRQATSYQSGDKVRIVAGLFSGKLGVVENVDTKAQVKVRVGKMSVVVSGHDLVPG